MKLRLATFFAGLLFGLGLTVSQMVNPEKVIAFLDIFGDWDPSLALVMGGALVVTLIGYRFVLKSAKPLFETKFCLPEKRDIDKRLIIGSGLFGVGWGLSGLCPGPALANFSFGGNNAIIFTTSMVATIAVFRIFKRT
ncbi:DUF6691 family protein [Litorimonas haliclonae]|uniref:DUF6691 family protein n=1 Tax=Litorimonas haliclonae TaxID=2081977 RepID=UPI0039EF88EA